MSKVVNLVLMTAVWTALFATMDLRAIGFGALVSWAILTFCTRLERGPYVETKVVLPRPIGILVLGLAFIRELLLSAFSVAKEAWRPRLAIKPAIVAIPLQVESDLEITVLASLISLTPGTLSMEVTPDKKTLYVHALVVDGDGEEVRASVRDRLERPVRNAFVVRGR